MTTTPRNVLIAVSDPWLRSALAAALRAESLRSHSAGDGYGAWACFLDARGEFDVVVADLALSGLSGLALVRRLRTVRPELRALLLADELMEPLRDALAEEGIAAARLPAPLAHLALRVEIASHPPLAAPGALQLQAVG
ncbi:MAG: response regulator [Acidobacteria bacterium]|nr:response regulator [Acidobacteriota bacterium]